MIVDAHVHLPVGEACDSLQQKKNRLLQEMKKNQVEQCIVISDSYLKSSIGSMDECVELFKSTPNVHIVGGISPLVAFRTQFSKLKEHLSNGSVIGIKLFTGHETFYLTDERLQQVYRLALRHHVPVLFHSGWDNSQYGSAALAAEVAEKYPELKLVCCHCFYPAIEKCLPLVEYPNVYFDISSVADNAAMLEDMAAKIRRLTEMAPERVIFGSDYSGCSQLAHIQFVKKLNLSKETEAGVLYGNSLQVYALSK